MIKTKKLDKKDWIGLLLIFIVVTFFVFLIYDFGLSLSLIIAGIFFIITLLAIKFNMIKRTSKEESKRLEKEFEQGLKLKSFKELQELKEYSESKLEKINSEINIKDKDSLNNIVANFMAFGVIMFFIFILYFGTFIPKDIFVSNINSSLEIGKNTINYAFDIIFDIFESIFIKLFDLGATTDSIFGFKFKVFYWLYWISIAYWIGWLYFWKILMKGSRWTIKNIYIPCYKNLIKKYKEGQNELNKKR